MTIVKAVKINEAETEMFRVLNAILPERKTFVQVSPTKIAHALFISESSVRYNVKKLVELGYLIQEGRAYKPTDKVLFLQEN